MDISNDQPLHRIAVWGLSGVICPEPFILLRVAPGEEVAWATTYTVRQDQ